MTQGSITRHLVEFALPLLAGNVFQQLYNMVDTWVVGNFVSNEAFSAVGTVGPIINMLIGFFMGLSSGAGVVISQYYGAHKPDRVRDTVHTAMVLTLVLCVAFTALGLALIPAMLALMNTPAEVLPESTAYLSIYFSGITGLLIYNMGSGILRAVGDSRRPFYFLVVSAGLNTVLDLVFVIRFRMGVAGVAWATIIAQAASAVLVLAVLLRTDSCVRLELRRLRVHWDMLGKIMQVGIPAALQMAVTAFSNVFVQSYINRFGPDCMSGWTAYTKIDQLMFLPMQSLALSATTFVGQNLGAGNAQRAHQGTRRALAISLAVTAVLMVPVLVLAPQLTAFFNRKAEVVAYGTLLLRYISPFYLLCCINQIYSGALRCPWSSCWAPSWCSARSICTSCPTISAMPCCLWPWGIPPDGWCAAPPPCCITAGLPWAGGGWWRTTDRQRSEWSMQQITVSLGQRSYPIEIGPGLLREARRRLEALPVKRWAVIADENTAALYAGALDLPVYTFPAGEGSKRLAVYEDLCRRLLADGRLYSRYPAAGRGSGPAAHLPAGPGGQQRRRQDRSGPAGGEEPHRLLLPAPAGAGGYGVPGHPAPAAAVLRHGGGHQVRRHRRRGHFAPPGNGGGAGSSLAGGALLPV